MTPSMEEQLEIRIFIFFTLCLISGSFNKNYHLNLVYPFSLFVPKFAPPFNHGPEH